MKSKATITNGYLFVERNMCKNKPAPQELPVNGKRVATAAFTFTIAASFYLTPPTG